MKNFIFPGDRAFLVKRLGDISVLAGAMRYEILDGKAKGIEAVDVHTGSGLDFTVLPGRGMDLSRASFKGVPLSFMSKTGVVSPSYYESAGTGWLRNFFGGLLTTCGLSNAGGPSEIDRGLLGKQALGLHGRISNACADNVCVRQGWQGDEFEIAVSGRVMEAMAFGESLALMREIRATGGGKRLFITDIVENLSPREAPLMLLYHINAGYPLLDEATVLRTKSREIIGVTEAAEADRANSAVMGPPRAVPGEHCYFHRLEPEADGRVTVAVVNPRLELGLYLRYDLAELPCFTQWKSFGEQDYALGIEPGNCRPTGFAVAKENNLVEMLPPLGRKIVHLEIGVLEDAETLAAIRGGRS